MTTNILSIGTAAPSKQSLLGSAEISAEGTVNPQNADPSETPFLPMFLQMLFMQNQIKPAEVKTGDTIALNSDGQTDGTSEISGETQSSPSLSILAGSIDGLTRLTIERTQPAMDALRSQVAQTQRTREGDDASMILPSLFGKNMRMPVANVQEVIRAVSFGVDANDLGTPLDVTAKMQSPITLDVDEVNKQSAREMLASMTQSTEKPTSTTPVPSALNGFSVKNEVVGQTESYTNDRVPKAVLDDARRTEKQPSASTGNSALLNSLKDSFDEAMKIVTASKSSTERSSAAAAEQNEERSSVETTPASVPQQPLEVKSEKKTRDARPINQNDASGEENRISADGSAVVAPTQSANDSADRSASDESGMMPEKNPQQPLRNDTQEFRRVAMDAETGALKAPASLSEVRGTERVASEAFKPETIRSMMEQLSKGVAVAVDEKHSEMKLILHPEALGEVTVRVQVEEGRVSAKLDVQQVQVKNTIEANMPQLREALTSRGLTMESIEISTAQNGLADGTSKQQQSKQGKRSNRGFDMPEEEQDVVKMYGYNTVEYTV
ncbi:MAG: flagellar hook-length control protein FliK [Bacteroidetes bacterium]|nr:flagellar hook-length control protein FliK [Bacteroidota bacterium]